MAISFNRYVNIISGVAAGAVVPRRDLVARLFTSNALLPPQSVIQFTNAAEVGQYFGTSSEEYQRALFYFSFTSKNITKPQFIQYARWVQTATPPMIFGNAAQGQALATYTAITSGSISLTLGAITQNFTGINFSAATSLANVASILQTAIQAGPNTQFSAASVTYNSTTNTFNLVGGSAVSAGVAVAAGTGGTDISMIIGWFPQQQIINGNIVPGAIWAIGSLAETITQTLQNSVNFSNNFGSFAFVPALTSLPQAILAAQWNENENVLFMFCLPVTTANATNSTGGWLATDGTGLATIGGTAITLQGPTGQYQEMMPMCILAATDYTQPNSVQNYEFQQFPGQTPTVTTDTVANAMDSISVNYYGRTQDAGQFIDFYQQGVMLGLATDPLDQNTYANEMWLKDAAGSAIMTLLLGLNRISANDKGRGQIASVLQTTVNQAVFNGTISVDKMLSQTQKVFITEITRDPNAYYQVQTIGYWFNVVITLNTTTNKYEAFYTLVYSKDDIIRKVNGRHVLI